MQDVWQKLQNTARPIFIYGTGNGADAVMNELEILNIKVSGVFASDDFVRDRTFRSFSVKNYSLVKKSNQNMIALLCFGTSRESVIENIKKISEETTLLMPSVPVYGENIFNLGFVKKYGDEIRKAYDLLADEKSRRTFESIVNFRLSGNLSNLFDCEKSEESSVKLLGLTDEIYMDLGAYRGDTVIKTKQVCTLIKTYAVEPDERSFSKLLENTKDIENIEYFNCGIDKRNGEMNFSSNRGRGSSSADNGEKKQTKSVDEILSGRKVTFIKADVEGNEKAALFGAEKTIAKYKPKLRVAAYHRAEDIFTLPLLINSLNNEYKIYLRHTHCIPDWDTDIFAI